MYPRGLSLSLLYAYCKKMDLSLERGPFLYYILFFAQIPLNDGLSSFIFQALCCQLVV